MSKKENKIEEIVEVTEAEVEVAEETKTEGKLSKVVGGVKKHGKKVAAGVAIVVGGLLCYALGKGSGGGDSEDYEYAEEEVETSDCEDSGDVETE